MYIIAVINKACSYDMVSAGKVIFLRFVYDLNKFFSTHFSSDTIFIYPEISFILLINHKKIFINFGIYHLYL
ncbi:hypothetical protein DMW60_20410 [Serratia marcescens]|nr:hypothetical protein DMW60_20410 [Serratia marcescens]